MSGFSSDFFDGFWNADAILISPRYYYVFVQREIDRGRYPKRRADGKAAQRGERSEA